MSMKKRLGIIKLVGKASKRGNFFLIKSGLLFNFYKELVGEVVGSVEELQGSNIPLQIHQYVANYDFILIDGIYIYWETDTDFLGWLE